MDALTLNPPAPKVEVTGMPHRSRHHDHPSILNTAVVRVAELRRWCRTYPEATASKLSELLREETDGSE